jgi:type IV pilus assembly protein PilC
MRLMLNAGYGIVQAMDHAGQVTASPWITNACGRAQTLVQEGLAVSQALRSTGAFPEELLQFWATGEESGRMDEMLDRLARQYEERWRRSLDVLATWLPRFAYAAVGVFIIFQMISLLGPIIAAYSEALQ